ncbi:hypothetical protein ACFLSF_04410 [Candidatus Bipolaricaulota bacterium]
MSTETDWWQGGLAQVIDELGFQSLERILFGTEGSKQLFSTLPFVDAVYYPPDADDVPDHILPGLAAPVEEDIHLYQCRRSSAGWHLERLSRRVCRLMERHERGQSCVPAILSAWSLLSEYQKSIQVPLELEAHCLIGVFLMGSEGKMVDTIHDGFLRMFSFAEQRVDRDGSRLEIEERYLERWRSTLRTTLETEARPLRHTSAWLARVSEELHSVSRDFWRRGSISEDEYLEGIGNCLQFKTIPSVAGLMPTDMPRAGFQGTEMDPHARMEKAAEFLADLPPEAIRAGDLSKVMGRIEAAIPVCDKSEILNQRVRAAQEIPRAWPRCALGPLRLSPESLDVDLQAGWKRPSELHPALNDTYEASLVIRMRGGQLLTELENRDVLGKRFLKELGLLDRASELVAGVT